MIWVRALAIGAIVFTLALPGMATAAPPADIKSIQTRLSFDDLVARLESAIAANKMGLVAQASASAGAASRGVKIPGNAVLMVFRNDFAVRMLAASVPAGIEAPIRYYVTENADGTATLSYRPPSVVFAPYGSAKLDELARELDAIFDKIGRDATGG
ncbi:MAG: DUF302 domain-containing protein [Rhodospirillales bacterium]|nr:DUF302 domain-containing protein [Rhodospirillales bacterium]